MTFVDDLMHRDVWRDFHNWQSLGAVMTEKQANEKKISNYEFIREGEVPCSMAQCD